MTYRGQSSNKKLLLKRDTGNNAWVKMDLIGYMLHDLQSLHAI